MNPVGCMNAQAGNLAVALGKAINDTGHGVVVEQTRRGQSFGRQPGGLGHLPVPEANRHSCQACICIASSTTTHTTGRGGLALGLDVLAEIVEPGPRFERNFDIDEADVWRGGSRARSRRGIPRTSIEPGQQLGGLGHGSVVAASAGEVEK